MIELLSTETKPVYIGYNKLAADVAEATTDALTGADYIALQATIKYLWFMVILLAVVALLALVVAVIASVVASSENWASESDATWVCFFTKGELTLSENNAACRPVCIPSRFVRYLNLMPMKVSDGQLKMYRPITAFALVLFDGRTITVGFATPEEVSSLKWAVMSMLPNAECVEDGSIDRKACRKLGWDFKKKYSFRIGAFRRDFLD